MSEFRVIKRDGRVVPFERSRIERAIYRCLVEVGSGSDSITGQVAALLTDLVLMIIEHEYLYDEDGPDDPEPKTEISVEIIQDAVEQALVKRDYYDAAKAYILYRAEHAKLRDDRPVPREIRAAFAESKQYFKQPFQELVYYLNYARWSDEMGRRETWVETVDRAVSFLHELASPYADLGSETYEQIRRGILEMRAMPSMRLLATAGPAARRSSVCIYNCSTMGISCIDAFVEALLISMSGCGVGFSVEALYVDQLPPIKTQRGLRPSWHIVEDSTEGWGDALRDGLQSWFDGDDVLFDFSNIRPAGAILKTKGGRASGSQPLKDLLEFARTRILARQGKRLRPIDAHDLTCAVGNAAVMGGHRRSAMISLFDADDEAMRFAKAPGFDRENSQRWNANNSLVWDGSGTQEEFVSRFMEMVRSGNGEPGIFNRVAANSFLPARRKPYPWLTNPCSETLMRDMQYCNLSISVARSDDTLETLREKVRLASIIGTIQSLAVNFPGLRPGWKQNCEDERLLGVDITGQFDCPVVQDERTLQRLKREAVETNRLFAEKLGINQSAAVTCVKPSGNSGQLLDVSSGMHPRYAPYYIRRYRVAATSPLYRVLKSAGVPLSPENGQQSDSAVTWVASFPVKSPEGAITREDISALEHLEYWLMVRRHYTEHKPSATLYYGPDEIIDLMKQVWDHRHEIDGVTFLPRDNARLEQAPYEEISEDEYVAMAAAFPEIDFSKVVRYEADDHTTAAQELSCSAGFCETI